MKVKLPNCGHCTSYQIDFIKFLQIAIYSGVSHLYCLWLHGFFPDRIHVFVRRHVVDATVDAVVVVVMNKAANDFIRLLITFIFVTLITLYL